MKKLLILLAIVATASGCDIIEGSKKTSTNPMIPPVATTGWFKETWDDHTYCIRAGGIHGYGSGIAHDPKCITCKTSLTVIPKEDLQDYNKYIELKQKFEKTKKD